MIQCFCAAMALSSTSISLVTRADATASQTVRICVQPIAVLAVKHGGARAGGVDLGDRSTVTLENGVVNVRGDRLAWTANMRAKVTVQTAASGSGVKVRAAKIIGNGHATGWTMVGAASVLVAGIDREIGGCELEYALEPSPPVRTIETVVATYTITAE